MAQFEQAIGKTLLNEGGYSYNPSDSGGETYEGISRNNWPNWNGWNFVDAHDFQNPNLQALVVSFYRQNFWQYDAINDQEVANKVFDLAVNVGRSHANKMLQIAAGVRADGIMGPATIQAINAHPDGSLTPLIRIAAENYYKEIVATHPQDSIFLDGWLRRADS